MLSSVSPPDEDVENMMEAHDRFAHTSIHSKTAPLRVFLFPKEADSRASTTVRGGMGPGSALDRGRPEASSIVDYFRSCDSDQQPRDPCQTIPISDLRSPASVVYLPSPPDLPPTKTVPHKPSPAVEQVSHPPLHLISMTREEHIESLASQSKQVFHPSLNLTGVLEEIVSIKTQMVEIYGNQLYGIGVPQVEKISHGSWSRNSATNVEEQTMVGFDHEIQTIKERLVGASKQLQVISIVGMGGLGKTTLVKKLYVISIVGMGGFGKRTLVKNCTMTVYCISLLYSWVDIFLSSVSNDGVVVWHSKFCCAAGKMEFITK
ncbi:hypothetical protein F0562_034447 [Nyssa sinensis]|uniref:NB-ARC domain-containing protein n=1 Tax=Nyssa sinensis TaxID=561372 RepID=A0A5J5AIB1_9ASTE|nr:hypothetical protein F0562_034447 [Nyssa sinensis]